VCKTSYQLGNLQPNQHLASIVKRLREIVLSSEKQPKVSLCALHGEKLLFFCKKDKKVICWLCECSQDHCGHNVFLVGEVAEEYK
jgi:tripartite motif-containing protein 6/22/34